MALPFRVILVNGRSRSEVVDLSEPGDERREPASLVVGSKTRAKMSNEMCG